MGELNTRNNARYEFVAPEIEADANRTVEVPIRTAERFTLSESDTDFAIDVCRTDTYISFTGMGSDNVDLRLTPDAKLPLGSKVYVDFTHAAGAELPATLTIKQGEDTIAAISSSTDGTVSCILIYNGEKFTIYAQPATAPEPVQPTFESMDMGSGAVKPTANVTMATYHYAEGDNTLQIDVSPDNPAPVGATLIVRIEGIPEDGTVNIPGQYDGHADRVTLVFTGEAWILTGVI